jgi:broad specificity phosphatase PhoE
MRLYLVRHGQTEWNSTGRAQGHTDIPLDEVGRIQAFLVGRHFESLKVDQVITSDLQRSRDTASLIADASGAELVEDKDLRERSFGDWEGQTFTWVTQQLLDASLAQQKPLTEVRPPNGESFFDVWNRIENVRQRLCETDLNTVVVCHGGTTSLLLAKLLRGSLDTSRGFRFANTSVTELTRRPEGLFLMVRYDDTAHLGDLAIRRIHGNLDGVAR